LEEPSEESYLIMFDFIEN